jgi:flagellar basal body L-ring protein FlgH
MNRTISTLLAVTFLLSGATSCSTLLGKLRTELDDQPPVFNDEPTYGGMWPEQGELQRTKRNYTRYDRVGHSERAPASLDTYDPSVPGGWVGEKDRENQQIAAGYAQYGYQGNVGMPGPPRFSQDRDMVPKTKGYYEKKTRTRAEDFYDEDQADASLWSSTGQTNYYFVKNSVKGPGDLVTITVKENIVQDIANEVKKTLTQMELKDELVAAQEKEVAEKTAELMKELKEKQRQQAARAPASAQPPTQTAQTTGGLDEGPAEVKSDIDAGIEVPEVEPTITYRTLNLREFVDVNDGEKFMAEILERYPNGNYKVRGTKRVPYKGETRLVTIVGIVRGKDLDDKTDIATDQMYEYMVKAYR